VVEHLVEADTVAMFKESGRVANFVILSTPNEWEWPEPIAFNKNVTIDTHKHITFHTKETLTEAAHKAGLNVIYYLKVNCEYVSHHIMVLSNTPLVPINYRLGMGTGLGSANQGMPVTVDEIISYIPVQKEEKKLNTE
jgi:hypothetical protein